MGSSGDAPVRCPTPFAHGPASPTRGCASSGTPPRWQTLLNRLSSANPLAHTPGAVGLHHPHPSAASAKMYAKIDNGIPHHHSRLAPPTLHRVALEASTSIRGYDHTPVVSSPRPCKPRAAQHLNPLFRTESPKTEVQTAIAVLQAAEAEKERIREERRDARAAAKEAKRHAGDTRGAAQRAAQSRAEILAHHRPARTDSLKDVSDSDDSSDSDGETSSLSSLETNEKASGNKRKHQTHAHDHHTRSKVAKRRKKETKHHSERKHHHHHHHHHSKHHSKHRHHSKRHSKHSSRKRDRDTVDDADDTSAVTARVQLRTDVDNRAKLDADDERKGRMEAEAVGMRRVWSKTGLSAMINRSCGNLVGMIENAYGSFIAGGEGGGGAPMSAASPRPDSPIPA